MSKVISLGCFADPKLQMVLDAAIKVLEESGCPEEVIQMNPLAGILLSTLLRAWEAGGFQGGAPDFDQMVEEIRGSR